ncbi:HigA family addiction module antitoxin [Duganella sp.]|uniref:HigA family addiction module antitoxin n=1 Tax=Duganella sp. TaxID=1904440 RepID=UPI0031CF4FF3
MADMFNPPHPGLTLRDDVLPAFKLPVAEAARQLDVAPQALSDILNGQAPITVEMALRIEAWLGVDRGGAVRVWLACQAAYDLWQARQCLADELSQVQSASLAAEFSE